MNRQELKNKIVDRVAMSGNRKPIIDTTINELLADIELFAKELNDIALIEFVQELKLNYA